MADYKITKSKIENHVEKIGIDLRPIIEPKMEQQHFSNFYNDLCGKYPHLYESLVQSPNDFQIRKKFIFPGKGEMDFVTAGLSRKGMTFIFPRVMAVINEEIHLGDSGIEDIIMDCIKLFRKNFISKEIRRVGHINEYIYTLGSHNSSKFIADRFTKIRVSGIKEIRLRVNMPDDDYNRVIELQPVEKLEVSPGVPGGRTVTAYGVSVKVDFNNRDTSSNLSDDKIRHIIQGSLVFNGTSLYEFLSGSNVKDDLQ